MKKRKIKNIVIFTILLSLNVLLFSSLSIAGTNTKLTNSTKNTNDKDIQKVQSEKKQKTETIPATNEKSSNLNSTKSTEVKKNITSDDDIKKYNIDIQKNNISKSESIINPKSNTDLQNSNDNEMIKNPLNNDTSTSQTYQHIPRQTLELDEIDELDDVHTVSYDNVEYKCHNGYYYRHWGRHYRRMRPPWGLRIRWLPRYYYVYIFNDCRYFYCCNVFYIYIEDENEYIVVRPPIGALVETIPEYSEQLIVDGETYYIADGIQYKAVIVNEEIWFKVIKVNDKNEYEIVKLPVGVLVETIPEYSEQLIIDGETYYIAEDIQYKAVIVNEEIWFKILKVG